MKRFLKPSQVAEILQCDLSLVYRMAARGELPSIKLSRRGVRIDQAGLERWIKENLNGVGIGRRKKAI